MTQDLTAESVAAWRKNIAPPTPTTYNHFFQITENQAGTPTIFALVTWNWVRGWYEVRPVCFIDANTYKHANLNLNLKSWYRLRHMFRNLGVKHMKGITCKDKKKAKRTSTLPKSLVLTRV